MSGLAATTVDICSQIILIKMGHDKATANTWKFNKILKFWELPKGNNEFFHLIRVK